MNAAHLQPLFDYLNEGAIVIATALAGYAVTFLKAWLTTHLSFVDQKTKDAMLATAEQAMQHGGAYALKLLESEEAQHQAVNFPGGVKGWALAKATQYAVGHAGQEINKLGWSPDLIAQKILVRLPPIPATKEDTTGATVEAGSPLPAH